MNKKALQVVTLILALVPTLTGIVGLMGLDDPIYGQHSGNGNEILDSNLRFFSGLWLGIGITLFFIIKRIDAPLQSQVFRMVWGCIFLGGVGRLLSMFFAGPPPLPFVGFTLLEILGAPFFIYWQKKIAAK